jgi:hypothetical protein
MKDGRRAAPVLLGWLVTTYADSVTSEPLRCREFLPAEHGPAAHDLAAAYFRAERGPADAPCAHVVMDYVWADVA